MDHPAQSAIEARGVFGELIAEIERAGGAGRGNGGNGGNGGGHGGDGGAGDGMGPVDGRMLIDSLRQVAELQTKCSLTLADAMIKALEREREARQNEALALAQQLTVALRASADTAEHLAEHLAALADRVGALEHQLAAQRPAAGEDEGSGL